MKYIPKFVCEPTPVGVAEIPTYQSCWVCVVFAPEGRSPLTPGLAIKSTYDVDPLQAVHVADPDPATACEVSGCTISHTWQITPDGALFMLALSYI